MFCQKACNPASPNAALLCQHRLDRLGCQVRPQALCIADEHRPTYLSTVRGTSFDRLTHADAQINGTFQSCQGDDQQFPGIYTTTVNGLPTTTLFDQGPETQVISTVPFTMTVPATSSCSTYTSAALYTDALSLGGASATAAAAAAATAAPSAGSSNSVAVAAASSTAKTGDALSLRVRFTIIGGALFAAALLA